MLLVIGLELADFFYRYCNLERVFCKDGGCLERQHRINSRVAQNPFDKSSSVQPAQF